MMPLLMLALMTAAPSPAPVVAPTVGRSFAGSADLQVAIAAMARDLKPGQHFAWRPVLQDRAYVAALEYWTAPGRPAVHPTDAEYTIVMEGAGTLVLGGRLIDPTVTRPDLVEGSRIDGGTRIPLKAGDAMLIPANTPHWFGVDGRKLVLLGIKLPQTKQ
jgi:mannose-6-phosphate isomerase-like protein (cupin superfamily)